MHRKSKGLVSLALYSVFALCSPTFCRAQIEIPEGTKVGVRLDQQLSSETSKVGESVQLSVASDVKIGNVVAIKAGTAVIGKVLTAVHEKNMGRAGKLDFSVDAILAPDGEKIPLRYSPEKNKGGNSTGAGIVTYVLFGVPGLLFLNGHDAVLYEGTAYDVFTDATYELKTEAPAALGAALPAAPSQASTLPTDAPTIGAVYFLDIPNQILRPLLDESWTARKFGDSGMIEVAGQHSAFRVTEDRPAFVYKIGNPQNAQIYALAADTQDKKKVQRWFSLVHRAGRTEQVSPGIPADITKFGESSFKVVPRQSLPPGEYTVFLSGSKAFTFGVDR
jgi:hypothetical protein